MTAQDWRNKSREAAQKEAQPLNLPSGITVQARRPDPSYLLMWGHIPLGLAGSVTEPGYPLRPEGAVSPDQGQILASIQLSRDILTYCVVEPRISLTPGPDEIHPKDIPLEDAVFILRWAMRRQEADALRGFRPDGEHDGDRRDSQAVRPAPLDPGSDPGPGDSSGVRSGRRSPDRNSIPGVRFHHTL